MKDKDFVKSLVCIGACAAVIGVVFVKRDKISKKINKAFYKKLKSKIKSTTAVISHAIVTQEAIGRRAFEIYLSGEAGSPIDHWIRAERELKSRQYK